MRTTAFRNSKRSSWTERRNYDY